MTRPLSPLTRALAIVAVSYSHDFDRWEPDASVKRVFQWGDPLVEDVPRLVSRFQVSDQSIWVFAVGLEHRAGATFGLEAGVFSNRTAGATSSLKRDLRPAT